MSTPDLTVGNIGGHFRNLAVPAAFGLLFTTLYNVVDVYFAGLLGTASQAGLAIAFQVFFMVVAVGLGLGAAMTALLGHALGRKDQQAVQQLLAQGLGLALITSLLLLLVAFFAAPLLLALISSAGAYREAALAYFQVLLLAVPGFVLGFSANGILQAKGDTASMQYAMAVAFLANLVLDPLLMFGLPGIWGGMGFNGIALATALSQTGVMVFLLWRVKRLGLLADLRLADFAPRLTTLTRIMAQMLPVTFSLLVMIVAGLVVQFYLKRFGADAVAAYGVALRIEQLFLLPVFGLTGALLPIAAQNYGATHFARVRESLLTCWKLGWLFMLVACPLLWFAAEPMMRLFTQDAQVIAIGVSYLHVDGLILPFYMMLFAINALLQALQQSLWTLVIGLYRQGLAIALFIWLWVSVWQFDVLSVWFGIATSVLSGWLLALLIAQCIAKPRIGSLWQAASSPN